MKPLKIYLDTSVINFLFHEDVPEFRKITEEFFEEYVKRQAYDVNISEVVIQEIERTPDQAKRAQLAGVVETYDLTILPLTEEADRLAAAYVEAGILPSKKFEDAQHVAIATCNMMDILLSWNFRHLANVHKQLAVRVINQREGYFYPLKLTSPMEAFDENE